MIYSLEQLKKIAEPLVKKYKLKSLWVFGSYARGEATEKSDVDFLMDYTDSIIINLYDLVDINNDFTQIFGKKIDLISTDALLSPRMKKLDPEFIDTVTKERVKLYEKS